MKQNRIRLPERKALRQLFVEGNGRLIGRPLYHVSTAAELFLERALDRLHAPTPVDLSFLDEQVTAVIKTFERPHDLQRLLASVRRFYPKLPIIVVDDSRAPGQQPGVHTIPMPYDSGISAGRNEGLRQVSTPYVLIMDDDFVFTRGTRLPQALALLAAEPRIDIMGGAVVDLPLYHVVDYSRAEIFPTAAAPLFAAGSSLAGLPVYDKVPNFFLARTERLRLVPWDENLKRMEHADFFTRAKGRLCTVYNEEMRCLHIKTYFDPAYLERRNDVTFETAYLLARYYGHDAPPGRTADATAGS